MVKNIYILLILLFFSILGFADAKIIVEHDNGTVETFYSQDGYEVVLKEQCEPQVIEKWIESPEDDHRVTFHIGSGHYRYMNNNLVYGATMNKEWNRILLGTTVLSNETFLFNIGTEF